MADVPASAVRPTPIAGMMLSQSGVAWGATEMPYKPTKAGGGGPLKMLLWQAPTLLNPHFANGTKDALGSRHLVRRAVHVGKMQQVYPDKPVVAV